MKVKLFLIAAIFFSCNREKTLKPQIKSFVESVYASGKILPEEGHKIFAMNDGILSTQLVQEGEEVKEGQIIFRIENVAQDARLKVAKESYKLASENLGNNSPVLQEALNQLYNAREKLTNDSINYERIKGLITENIGTKVEFDRAQLAYNMSKNDYQAAKKRYLKLKNQLYLELQNSKSQYKISEQDLSYNQVKSDLDGLLYEVYKKPGEAVRRGEAVVFVGRKANMYLQMWIDEEDVSIVKPGQKAIVTLDMFKDQYFEAEITKVYPVLNAENQSIKVEAVFKSTMPPIVSNASAEANIIIQEKQKALALPKTAIISADSVLIKTENGSKKIKIKKGIESPDFVEVVSGIDANTVVIEK